MCVRLRGTEWSAELNQLYREEGAKQGGNWLQRFLFLRRGWFHDPKIVQGWGGLGNWQLQTGPRINLTCLSRSPPWIWLLHLKIKMLPLSSGPHHEAGLNVGGSGTQRPQIMLFLPVVTSNPIDASFNPPEQGFLESIGDIVSFGLAYQPTPFSKLSK